MKHLQPHGRGARHVAGRARCPDHRGAHPRVRAAREIAALATACRAPARCSCRNPLSAYRRHSCAPTSRAPTRSPAAVRTGSDGRALASARSRRSQGLNLRTVHTAAARARHRGQLQELFIRNRWTDFLPITLPTEERVARMLKGTSHPPDKVVGRLRPTAFREFWEFTVEKVAVNAVMAGARPEYLPVILAMAASGQTARSSSTNSFATISVVNGPIRNEIGMDSGIGAIGPYNHATRDRSRLWPAVAESAGRLGTGRNLHGYAGNWYGLHGGVPEAEERSPLGAVHVRSTVSSRLDLPSASSSAAGTPTPARARAKPGKTY